MCFQVFISCKFIDLHSEQLMCALTMLPDQLDVLVPLWALKSIFRVQGPNTWQQLM